MFSHILGRNKDGERNVLGHVLFCVVVCLGSYDVVRDYDICTDSHRGVNMKRIIMVGLMILCLVNTGCAIQPATVNVSAGSITQMDLSTEQRFTVWECLRDKWCRDFMRQHIHEINGSFYLELE